ncbi:MAG: Crp/Fnr family transcriptional regulator [Bacteroidales bacterium]
MELKERLVKHFEFTNEDWNITEKYIDYVQLKAKEFFLHEGKVSDRIGVVKSGLLRTYFFDENGDEITTQFFVPGTLVISNVSFNRQIPSKENIIAIEPSELIVFTYHNMQELIQKVPVWQKVPIAAAEHKNRQKEKRILEFQTMPAKQRYLNFIEKHPQVCRSATVGQIASYLGIDIATLSRIRKKI